MSETSILLASNGKISREELALVPTPPATATHRPVPHHVIVEALVETLGFRQIGVIREEYAVSGDGMKMFGVLDLATAFEGCRFSIGLRNSHDKSFRLAITVGVRVLVCENMAFRATSRQCWRNTPRISPSRTACRSASTGCNGTSSQCAARWSAGAHSN